MVTNISLSSWQGSHHWVRQEEVWFGSCCAAAHCDILWVLWANVTGNSPPQQLYACNSFLQKIPLLLGHFLQARTSPLFQPPKSHFSNVSALRVESQCIRLPPVSASCHFINWRILDVPLLFCPGIIKVYKQSILVAAGKELLEALKAQISTFPHTTNCLPPLHMQNLSYFYFIFFSATAGPPTCSLTLHLGDKYHENNIANTLVSRELSSPEQFKTPVTYPR